MIVEVKDEGVGTLALEEAHPAAWNALTWIRAQDPLELFKWQSAYASCAISGGNRLAEVCSETLHRLMTGKPVSDRYLLGLAWSMRYGEPEGAQVTEKSKRKARKSKGSEEGAGVEYAPKRRGRKPKLANA